MNPRVAAHPGTGSPLLNQRSEFCQGVLPGVEGGNFPLAGFFLLLLLCQHTGKAQTRFWVGTRDGIDSLVGEDQAMVLGGRIQPSGLSLGFPYRLP